MKGIIFDLDGTMVDNMMVHHRIWQRLLKELGLELTLEQVRQTIHGVNEEIFERLFGERFSKEEIRKLALKKEAVYRRVYKPRVELIKGLPVFLQTLKDADIPLGIGSAAPPENVDFILNTLNIRDYFQVVLHSNDVENGKPHPEIYLKAARQLNLSAKDCIIFEDSPTGAEAAGRAGSKVVILTTTHTPEEFEQNSNIIKYITDYNEISMNELMR